VEIFDWIEQALEPRECNSEEFIYDDMESQSGRCLPIIYQPFDLAKRMHWTDRGALFDFLCATSGWDGKILDFGPGDGWPALIVAPFVKEIVGVEGSRRRCDVCRENARRLAITNATFEYVEPGNPLPFDDNTFDGAMAASSIEQTPDPEAALQEIHRVLKPGGRVRIFYEDLDRYRDGREREIDVERLDDERTYIIVYDRRPDDECAKMYSMVLSVPIEKALSLFPVAAGSHSLDSLTVRQLEKARPFIVETRVCRLTHPSGKTLVRRLRDMTFSEARATHSGIRFAGRLFDRTPEDERPLDLAGLDRLLRPLVEIVVEMAAPLDSNLPITAVK
jgi:ubiquinone/menaquinone biosynthesis C-methylase UbiE